MLLIARAQFRRRLYEQPEDDSAIVLREINKPSLYNQATELD